VLYLLLKVARSSQYGRGQGWRSVRFFGRGSIGMDEGGVGCFNGEEDEDEGRSGLGKSRAITRRDT